MANYTGKRFVTKITLKDYEVNSYWSERAGREIVEYGNIWGIWDKMNEAWVVCSENIMVEDVNRGVLKDLADQLNKYGYTDDYGYAK